MTTINKKIFNFLILAIAVVTLTVNSCFALTTETSNLYRQIESKTLSLNKATREISKGFEQLNKFKNDFNKIKLSDSEYLKDAQKLRDKEQKYVDSLPIKQAKTETIELIAVLKEFLPNLYKEEYEIDEVYTYVKIKNQLLTCTGTLEKSLKYNEAIYNLKLKFVEQQKEQLFVERDFSIAQIGYLKKKVSEKQAKIAGIEAQLRDLEAITWSKQEEMEKAKKRMQEVIKDREELEKYCWIPFYRIYLLAKNLDNEVNEKYRHAEKQFNQFNEQLGEQKKEYNDLKSEFSILKQEIDEAQRLSNTLTNSQKYYMEQINSLTSTKIQYEDIIVEIGKLTNSIEHNNGSVDSILELLDTITNKYKKKTL